MARLVAYGCSFTYGTGLSDSYYSYEPDWYGPLQPSITQSWVGVAARELGLTPVNRGIPGASNLEILVRALRSDHESSDVVVFLWTWPNRDLTFTTQPIPHAGDGKQWWQLGPWSRGTDARKLAASDTEFDYVQRLFLYQHHAELALINRVSKVIHWTATKIDLDRPDHWPIQHYYNAGFSGCDLGSDQLHPGPLAHRETGVAIANRIRSIPNAI